MIGGLENYVYNLSRNQVLHGYDVTILTLNRDFITNNKLSAYEAHTSGVKIIRIPFFFSKKYPVAPSVYNYLKIYDLINVHAVDFFADFIALTKIFQKKKIILTTHGGYFHTKWGHIFKKFYFATVTKFVLKLYDQLIGCSDNDLTIFKKINDKIIIIENGVDIEPYLNTPKNAQKGELLYVGRLDHHKRIDLLIRIIARLNEKGYSAKLNIVGPDCKNLSCGLTNYAKKLNVQNNISFKGKVSEGELKDLYSSAFIFVSASEYEGFGISVIEAMASGTLCVLNRIPSFEKFLKNNSFGYLCNFSDQEETADIISGMLKTDELTYKKLSQAARNYSGNYSWKSVINKYNEIYNKLLLHILIILMPLFAKLMIY